MNNEGSYIKLDAFGIHCGFDCIARNRLFLDHDMEGYHVYCTRKLWLIVLSLLFLLECYMNISVYKSTQIGTDNRKLDYIYGEAENRVYYKYPLDNLSEISMNYNKGYNSSYYWFISMKHMFKNIGYEEVEYSIGTPTCQLNETSLGRIIVNKTEAELAWIEKENNDVELGGYHAPEHCRATHRVAIIVPYRNRRLNLIIFLRYLHPLLKKQLLEYRIFVIEQYGSGKFNKGTLYNIAFLETQRFGNWHCLIFHDVDLIPEDERISYSCPEHPTHMAAAVESWGYVVPYRYVFGGVTALTPLQYETVNGYSNLYLNWGGEDDDFYGRIQSNNLTVLRYNSSIARYACLPHLSNALGQERTMLLSMSRSRSRREGLKTTTYNLIKITKQKLYTHILADVNPMKKKLDSKSLMQRLVHFNGKNIIYGKKEYKFAVPQSL